MADKLDELRKLREQASIGGGLERIKKHKEKQFDSHDKMYIWFDPDDQCIPILSGQNKWNDRQTHQGNQNTFQIVLKQMEGCRQPE